MLLRISSTLRDLMVRHCAAGLLRAMAACSRVEWRAAAHEDGHYCFAVPL